MTHPQELIKQVIVPLRHMSKNGFFPITMRDQMELVISAAQELQEWVDKQLIRKLSEAPCSKCGYNGAGYYQPDTHPCAGELERKRIMKVYIVAIGDRFIDIQIMLDKDAAIARARMMAQDYCCDEGVYREKQIDGYLFYAEYSIVGDFIAILEREVE